MWCATRSSLVCQTSHSRSRRRPKARKTVRGQPWLRQKVPQVGRKCSWAWALRAGSSAQMASFTTSALVRSGTRRTSTRGATATARRLVPRMCCVASLCVQRPGNSPPLPRRYSCAWELPESVRAKVVDEGMDLSQAFQHISADPLIGDKGGAIAVCTRVLTGWSALAGDSPQRAAALAAVLRPPRCLGVCGRHAGRS